MSTAQSIGATIGYHGFWGFSSSFDWLDAISRTDASIDKPIKILLVAPGDIRHVLTTVAKRRRHSGKQVKLPPIHFYVIEPQLEILARDILLLEMLSDYEVPIRQRATIFLETFGNLKVQERTSRYIEQLGYQLRSLITDNTGRLEGIIDLSQMKYRERDELELIFRSYSRDVPCDMASLFDHRLRGYYADRYDSRRAVADWDYYQVFKETSASIVHIRQFRDWRLSGVAFEFGDQIYTQPNRTMTSYAEGVMKKGKDKGIKKEVRGYWGDIVASPYFSLGIDADAPNKFAEGLFEILSKDTGTEQHRHHTVEIALYNMFCYLWEIETGEKYRLMKANDIYSGLGAERDAPPGAGGLDPVEEGEEGKEGGATDEDLPVLEFDEDPNDVKDATPEDDDGEGSEESKHSKDDAVRDAQASAVAGHMDTVKGNEKSCINGYDEAGDLASDPAGVKDRDEMAAAIQRAENIVESWQDIKIFPMCGDPLSILDKSKYVGAFDAAFLSVRVGQLASSPLMNKVLRGTACVAIESAKFLSHLPKQQREEYLGKVGELAAGQQWAAMAPPMQRRKRDERDATEDVLFFSRKS
jgi:dynein assembly factor 3